MKNILEQKSERIFLQSVTNNNIPPFTSCKWRKILRFSIMLLAVTCICILIVSGGKTSKCFCINTDLGEPEAFSSFRNASLHPSIGLSYHFQCRMWTKRNLCAITDDTVLLKSNSTLNSRTSVIINIHTQHENSCWSLLWFSLLLTPWPWQNNSLLLVFFTKQLHIPIKSPILINLHIYLIL